MKFRNIVRSLIVSLFDYFSDACYATPAGTAATAATWYDIHAGSSTKGSHVYETDVIWHARTTPTWSDTAVHIISTVPVIQSLILKSEGSHYLLL